MTHKPQRDERRRRFNFRSLRRSLFALAWRTSRSVTKKLCSTMPFAASGIPFPAWPFPLTCVCIWERKFLKASFSSGVQGRPQSLQIRLSRSFLYPLTRAFWQSVEQVRAWRRMRFSGILLRSTIQKVWKDFIAESYAGGTRREKEILA